MNMSTDSQGAQTPTLSLKWPDFIRNHSTFWAGFAMIVIIFILSAIKGEFGKIGNDNDDMMRLVQIRDFLAGQSWFNTDQLRLGLAGGTDMHWSRLPDIPIIILAKVFALFASDEMALMIAYTAWPPLSASILIFAAVKGARFWDAERAGPKLRTYAFTLILLAFFVFNFYRFKPGAIDHHNIQMGLVCLAMAFCLDRQFRFKSFFIAGVATALSLAVGVEVYIFAAVFCGFVALNWLIEGDKARSATQGFGLGLSLGLALSFFGTIASSEYGRVLCDSLSLITISAGVAGGVGLAVSARFSSHFSIKGRLGALIGVGVICALLLTQQAPQCLANPLNVIPEQVDRLWLSKITEAQPLRLSDEDAFIQFPYLLGTPLLALFLLLKARWNAHKQSQAVWDSHVLVILLLLVSIALTLYQVRFYVFAYVFSILPLAAWVGRIYQAGLDRVNNHVAGDDAGPKPSNIKYIGALALSLPFIWGMPGALLDIAQEGADVPEEEVVACYSDDVMAQMKTLPTGFVMATSNGGAPLLTYTDHRSMSGNYHRNIAGIALQINIATTAPEAAEALLTKHDVDYVHFCKTDTQTLILIEENDKGLYAALQDENVPSYLTPVLSLEEGEVKIYKVTG